MKIDLNKLNNTNISLDEDFSIDLNEYKSKDIINLKNLHVKGTIKYNAADNIELDLHLTGSMFLKDSITLELIENPLDIFINEEYSLNDPYFAEYYEKEQNILDIMTILWENIVLEVPMRLTSHEDLNLSGEGWTFGGSKKLDDNIDPRLAKLAELLDERKE